VEFLNTLEQDDPLLVRYVKENMLVPPAPASQAYKLTKSALEEPSSGPTATVLYILDEKVRDILQTDPIERL
jgi:hypothetical protein